MDAACDALCTWLTSHGSEHYLKYISYKYSRETDIEIYKAHLMQYLLNLTDTTRYMWIMMFTYQV